MTLSITALYQYAECPILFIVMLNVILTNVVMLSVIVLNVGMLCVIVLNVVMLNVAVPLKCPV